MALKDKRKVLKRNCELERISSDILLRDKGGRLICKGTHRDIKSLRQSVSFPMKHIPLTNFKWEIPAAMVVTVPKNIDSRSEVSLLYNYFNLILFIEIQIYCGSIKILTFVN